MTPDRMRGFVNNIPVGGKAIALSVVTLTGRQHLATWERKEVEDTKGQTSNDVTEQLLAAAIEHTDGETVRQKFSVQWLGNRDKVCKSVTHWCSPPAHPPKASDDGRHHEGAGGVEGSLIYDALRDMLTAQATSNKLIVASLPAMHETINMLTQRLNEAYLALDERRAVERPEQQPETVVIELTEQQLAEVEQRTQALQLLMDKAPEVMDIGLAALSKWLLSDRGGGGGGGGDTSSPAAGETRVEPH